jgi:ribosome biogenesis GTPase / thiamine phosphate phosphatase
MRGTILKSTGSWYQVLGDDGVVYPSRVRGKLRLEEIKETNPVAVGDYVEIEPEGSEAVILNLLPRDNYIVRQSVKKTGHSHVIAANVDQAMLIVTLSFPRTSAGFIDRFTVAAESFRIPQILAFNKMDTWDDDEKEKVETLATMYRSVGITCLFTSAVADHQDEIMSLLANKKTLMAGLSGAGKSTLLNKLSGNIRQKTSEVSDVTSKGTHTTTFAEMFRLDPSTYIIDTPGIKELGLVDMKPEEVSDYFAEMRDVRNNCKYGSKCLHLSEPQCAVKAAVERGQIAESRYTSYVRIVSGDDNRK